MLLLLLSVCVCVLLSVELMYVYIVYCIVFYFDLYCSLCKRIDYLGTKTILYTVYVYSTAAELDVLWACFNII